MFEQMQGIGCQPDVVSFTALISAYERGGQWLLALEAFEEMVARGCRPDAIVYNAIIDALWQTGVIWAQVRVCARLWLGCGCVICAASRSAAAGLWRRYDRNCRTCNTIAI